MALSVVCFTPYVRAVYRSQGVVLNWIELKTTYLKISLWLILNIFAMICGPRSPTTTKYAMQVPIKKPIMPTSTANLPAGPNTWNAEQQYFNIRLSFHRIQFNLFIQVFSCYRSNDYNKHYYPYLKSDRSAQVGVAQKSSGVDLSAHILSRCVFYIQYRRTLIFQHQDVPTMYIKHIVSMGSYISFLDPIEH